MLEELSLKALPTFWWDPRVCFICCVSRQKLDLPFKWAWKYKSAQALNLDTRKRFIYGKIAPKCAPSLQYQGPCWG